jgi:hypothetical protein
MDPMVMEPLAESLGAEPALVSLALSALACSQEKRDEYSQRSICIFVRPVVGPEAVPGAQRMQ